MPYIVRETNAYGTYLYLHRRLGGGYFTTPTRKGSARFPTKALAEVEGVKHLRTMRFTVLKV